MSSQDTMSLGGKLRFLAMAGVGLFTDGYLNISIGLVVPMIGYIYFEEQKGSVPAVKGDEIKGSFSLGMIVGQLAFGFLGDALGRRHVYGRELLVVMFGTLMTILLPWKGLSQQGIVAWLSVFRMVTGVGTGGDYPMSSALAAEKNPLGSRAKLITTVFSFIGLGAFTSSIVYIVLLSAFKTAIEHNVKHLEWVWRLLLGLAIIPAGAQVYARFTMRETSPYKRYVAEDSSETTGRGAREQFDDFKTYFRQWKHAKALFAVSAVWFLYDIAFYGINLNQTVILSLIGYRTGKTTYETLHNTAVGNLIVQAAGYLPGYYIGIFLPDLIGRKRQQFWLSLVTAVLYAVWAGVADKASTAGLMVIFTISQLVLNAGPNVTTFLYPVEIFPTRVRGTAHGIAAASGKAGAVVTAFAFGTITDNLGLKGTLGLFSGFMALATLITLMLPETQGRTIDEIETEVLYGEQGKINDLWSLRSTPILMPTPQPEPEAGVLEDDKV